MQGISAVSYPNSLRKYITQKAFSATSIFNKAKRNLVVSLLEQDEKKQFMFIYINKYANINREMEAGYKAHF